MKKKTILTCVPLCTFTRFVPGYGQVHGDPNGVPEAQEVEIPFEAVQGFINDKLIEAPEGFDAPVSDEPEDEVDEADENADEKPVVPDAPSPPVLHSYLSGGAGGYFDVQAPWMDEAERVRGLAAANARAEEIDAEGDPNSPDEAEGGEGDTPDASNAPTEGEQEANAEPEGEANEQAGEAEASEEGGEEAVQSGAEGSAPA